MTVVHSRRVDLVGQRVGNYRLEVKLDEGAMGEVYLARHPMIGKEVAVKILRDELSRDAELVGRFFQEAKAVNEINHPNIVDIIDYGHIDDLFYFTMERLHGEKSGQPPLVHRTHARREQARAVAVRLRAGRLP